MSNTTRSSLVALSRHKLIPGRCTSARWWGSFWMPHNCKLGALRRNLFRCRRRWLSVSWRTNPQVQVRHCCQPWCGEREGVPQRHQQWFLSGHTCYRSILSMVLCMWEWRLRVGKRRWEGLCSESWWGLQLKLLCRCTYWAIHLWFCKYSNVIRNLTKEQLLKLTQESFYLRSFHQEFRQA